MTNDEQRLADAAEFGRRCAAETQVVIDEAIERNDRIVRYLNNRDAAQLHVRATGGTGQDALRLLFAAGDKVLAPPRPRLVISRS